ncbi:MAG: pantoate--beta-alanine ligase [Pseudomonadota bacterium]
MPTRLETVRSVAALRARISAWRAEGHTIALVPTMGALHEGHLSLVQRALARAERCVASLFVNPTQFGAGEDLAAYPRDEARDAALLAEAGCHLLYAPPPDEMYPPGFATTVRVGGLTDVLCGAARPGHFDGVAQVVTKLLNQAHADVAVFGEKDWQQLAVIRRLALDLDIATTIDGAPIVRASDGLALSSRNRYLDAQERTIAPHLHRVLAESAAEIAAGAAALPVCAGAVQSLLDIGFASVDYIECRDGVSLVPVERHAPGRHTRLFGAAHLGRARLIDNLALEPPS